MRATGGKLIWFVALGGLLVLLAVSCSNGSKVRLITESKEIAACADSVRVVNPCVRRDVSHFDLFSGQAGKGIAFVEEGAPSVEIVLAKGLEVAGASPTHLAIRRTAREGSVRCDWRGIARSLMQREAAVRLWLDLSEGDPIPDASYLEILFAVALETLAPAFPETAKSNFLSIAHGGVSAEYLFLTCYADYTVDEYLLGDGPTTVSLAYDRMGEARSYEL